MPKIKQLRIGYTGNPDKDLPSILLWLIAKSVTLGYLDNIPKNTKKIDKLAKFLEDRFRYLYLRNENWGQKIFKQEHKKNGSRDVIYDWMNHWAEAWIINPERFEKEIYLSLTK